MSKAADGHQVAVREVDFSVLSGTWKNLDPRTDYMTSLTLTRHGDDWRLQAVGSGADAVVWTAVIAEVFATNGAARAAGFFAQFTRDALEVAISATLNQGILVVQTYIKRAADSDGAHLFAKEYFRRESS